MITQVKPLTELNQQAIHILYRELGTINAIRFLKQFTVGLGDYTKEREILFADKTLDQIVSEIEQRRKSS